MAVGISFLRVCSVIGPSAKRHRGLLTTTTSPVALGCPTVCIVRPALCLLWPHLRLCRPPSGLWIIPSSCGSDPPAAEVPQFIPPVHSLHAVTRTPVAPAIALDDVFIAGSVFAELAPARQTQIPRLRTKWAA